MKKIVLLSGVSAALLSLNANAMEFNPYVSLKGSIAQIQNDTNAFSDYSYGGVTHHINTLSDKTHKDSVFGLKAAIGAAQELKYGKLRGELEFGTSESSKEHNNFPFKIRNDYVHDFDIKTSFYSAMLNLYYDIDTGTKFTPYVGAGLGLSHQKVTAGNAKKSSNELAWQVGGGVSYAAAENVSVDFGYRYIDNGSSFTVSRDEDDDVSGKTDFESEANEFYLGVRYAF